ncbi:MAG: hypothetical protein E3J57_06240 [Dehalococcoidia bacterium]|nr:MAG: hypothetical protein E3J57_06240 [Dehalococcoidia bacterium]
MSTAAIIPKKNAVCNTCTRRLVVIAYQCSPWFRLVREPLKFTMRHWARLYDFDPEEYEVRSPGCYRCLRFCKSTLKERSGLFRLLNWLVNPVFDAILERIVSKEEVKKAKAHARAAMEGEALPYDGDKYTRDPWWEKI